MKLESLMIVSLFSFLKFLIVGGILVKNPSYNYYDLDYFIILCKHHISLPERNGFYLKAISSANFDSLRKLILGNYIYLGLSVTPL